MELREGFRQTDLGIYPEDWSQRTIEEFGPYVTSGSRGWGSYYSEHGDLFVRITNLTREWIYLNLSDLRFVKLPQHSNEGLRTKLKENDILISITADIGIIGFVTNDVPTPAYINQHISLVRFDSESICPKFVSYFIASNAVQKIFRSLTDAGAKAGMNLSTVKQIKFMLPPSKLEQEAIANTLSDTDAYVESLEKLVAKKRLIKKGVMQELLTGIRRLKGCNSKLINKKLGEVAHIKTGNRNNQDKIEDGQYPFFVRSNHVERINTYSHDCEAILVPGEGGIGKIFHYINGRFDVHQRVYAITNFIPEVSAKYIYLYMSENFGAHAMENSVKATVDSLRLPTFLNFEITMPQLKEEQEAIANTLTDMEQEIRKCEEKLQKARLIKQGMMQELLTGRIRLV